MAALEESSPPKNQKKPKKPKKPKTPQIPLPEPQHTIDVLDDNEVFTQPGDLEYPYGFAYQIRSRILELETETTPLSEVNQFNFDLLRLKVRKYHTAYREHHAATDREISYQKMKEQHAAREEVMQCILSPAVYESRRLAERERITHPENEAEAEHGNTENPVMNEGVQDITHLFVGNKPVKSFMDEKENMCPICTEHLTENEFGHIYAIESKDEKHSEHGIKCGHKYHRTCISSWAKVHMNCPLCKSTIVKLHLAKEEKPEGGGKTNKGAEEKPKSPKSPKSPKGSGTKKTFGGSKIKTKKRSIQKKI